MNRIRHSKGITLVALVITIIVMLILAVVTINIVLDDRLFDFAGMASRGQAEETVKEQISIAYKKYQMATFANENPNIELIENSLKETYGENNVRVSAHETDNFPIRIKITGYDEYVIYKGNVEKNEEYTSIHGTVYRKYEVYTGSGSYGARYKDCDKMITLECNNFVMKYPTAYSIDGLVGCLNLKAIKMPVAQNTGHYVFTGLPALEYIEFGSIGHPWSGGGYFMKTSSDVPGFSVRSWGSPAGLTVVAYMNAYSSTAGFANGTPAASTKIIIRSATTGEIIQPE